jgi:heterokaryon incompatibility protein (HET)
MANMPARLSKSQAPFRHLRLSSPRSIRLLALLPSLEFKSELEAILTEVSLDNVSENKNSYEALSYVWGSRFGTEPIRCDGKQLLVTPNCESALRHLRLRDKTRILWIDAICIDQENNAFSTKERNSQVALMGEIYAKAAHTLCWFGQGNDFTDELMVHLERIGTCPSQRGLKKLMLFDGMCKQLQTYH